MLKKISLLPFQAAGAAVLLMVLVSGCVDTRPETRAAVRDSSVKGVVVTPVRADNAAQQTFALVNDERLRRGMLPLTRRRDLDTVAMAHARDLLRMNKLSHVSSDGRKLEHRMARLSWVRAGENLARNKGFDSPPAEAVRGWIHSPKHYENMFRPDFSETGMAALYDPDSGFTYFVQVFVVPA